MVSKYKFIWMAAAALALFGAVVASDVRSHENAVIHQAAPASAPVGPGQIQPANAGQSVPTQLPPELKALNAPFEKQRAADEAQLANTRNPDDREGLMRKISDGKEQQELAQLNLALEQVRAKGDADAEARILAKIQNITQPRAHTGTPVARDPNTGLEIKGGAR